MRKKYTTEEYKKIKDLVEGALASPKKAEAKKYSAQLKYIGTDVTGYSRTVYSELVAAVISASGAVRDKELFSRNANDCLIKFEMFCVE